MKITRWKTPLIACSALLFLGLPSLAEEAELVTPLVCDVNSDGIPDTVGIRPFTRDGVEMGRLVVVDENGKTIWEGPTKTSASALIEGREPEIFLGELDNGTLSVVGDLRGDGKTMLLGTYQKSDVSPTRFRLFEWAGKDGFQHVKSGYLTPTAGDQNVYAWSEDVNAQSWIESIDTLSDEGLLGATTGQVTAGQADEVALKLEGDEFIVTVP